MSKPISIQLYTVREIIKTPAEFRKVIQEIARIGYAGVESGPTGGGMDRKEYKRFLDDLGLKISSSWGQPNRENVNQIADDAAFFGYKHIAGCYGPDQVKTLADTEKTADAFEAMAQLLRPHGLTMCYHNHWWEFIEHGDEYAWDVIMRKGPTLAGEIDCYWASNFGEVDVPELIAKYKARTPLLHVKDGPLVKDQANVAVGHGKMDIPACVAAADPKALQWLIVELDKFDGDVMDAVRDSYTYLVESGLGHGRK